MTSMAEVSIPLLTDSATGGTVACPEREDITTTDLSSFEEFEIPCDGPRIWPERIKEHDFPARWVGVKNCGHSRLLCDGCKTFYQNLLAKVPYFKCDDCGHSRMESTFVYFEPLNGKS